MMRFKDLGQNMCGFRCLTLHGIGGEKCLASNRGEIWEAGPGKYKALIVHRRKFEKIIPFDANDLADWVLKLKVPADPKNQARWANSPNDRLS